MEKIVLKEDFDLIEIYNQLLESRGVIDGIDGIVGVVKDYVNNTILHELDRYYQGYDKVNGVYVYDFNIPCNVFEDVDTLFMKKPHINVQLFIMENPYGDKERQLGENNYLSLYKPEIITHNNVNYLNNPVFNIFFVLKQGEMVSFYDVGSRLSHEFVHAKKNFIEYITQSNKNDGNFNRYLLVVNKLSNGNKESLSNFVGRVLYLC